MPELRERPARRDERLLPSEKLRRRPDYVRCYRDGRRRHGPLATLHLFPNELERPRLGITASRKVGGSVVRHRLKRQVKEIYRRWSGRRQLPALDLVIHLKPAAAGSDFPRLNTEVKRLLRGALSERRTR